MSFRLQRRHYSHEIILAIRVYCLIDNQLLHLSINNTHEQAITNNSAINRTITSICLSFLFSAALQALSSALKVNDA